MESWCFEHHEQLSSALYCVMRTEIIRQQQDNLLDRETLSGIYSVSADTGGNCSCEGDSV